MSSGSPAPVRYRDGRSRKRKDTPLLAAAPRCNMTPGCRRRTTRRGENGEAWCSWCDPLGALQLRLRITALRTELRTIRRRNAALAEAAKLAAQAERLAGELPYSERSHRLHALLVELRTHLRQEPPR